MTPSLLVEEIVSADELKIFGSRFLHLEGGLQKGMRQGFSVSLFSILPVFGVSQNPGICKLGAADFKSQEKPLHFRYHPAAAVVSANTHSIPVFRWSVACYNR